MKILITTILLGILFPLLIGMTCNLNKSYWIRYCNESDSCGYKDMKGRIKVPLGKYVTLFTDTFINTAIVSTGFEVIGISKDLKKLYSVHIFDNGPDPISEGLFRIYNGNKFGFADMNGIVIQPSYDFIFPFSEGLAAFVEGCTFEKEKDGEHKIITGGKYGFINKKGDIIIKAKYDKALEFTNGQAKVIINNEHYIVNTKGEIVGK